MRDHRNPLQGSRDVQLALPVCACCGLLAQPGKLICDDCEDAELPPAVGARIVDSLHRRFAEEFGGVE